MPAQEIDIYKIVKTYARKLNSVSHSSQQEIEQVLMYFLNLENRAELYARSFRIEEALLNKIDEVIKKRQDRIPLQYLIPQINFYGLNFFIEEDVFIPRPETELLVDYVIKNFKHKSGLKIIEIGTGAGVISICLTKFLTECKIVATDINYKAINLAKKNAFLNKVEECILFVQGSLFNFIKQDRIFDLIVSNPPYVGEDSVDFLQEEVKKEPRAALIGGEKGCEFSLSLIKRGCQVLKNDGRLVLEIDERQRNFYKKFLSSNFSIEFIKDFSGKYRVMVVGIKNG